MALGPGSIAFLGFDADGTNRLAIVAVDNLPGGTEIFLTDRVWDGSAFTGRGEGTLTWTVPSGGIAPGTVVTFDNVGGSNPTLSAELAGQGTAAGSLSRSTGFDVGGSDEVIYAFIGSDANTPTSFLAAIANDGFNTTNGVLPADLTVGETAVDLGTVDPDADFAVYDPALGGADFGTDRAAMLSAVNNPQNWVVRDGPGDQSTGFVPLLTNLGSPINDVTFVICFLTGTRIATPAGAAPVETLRPGDLVTLADGATAAVRWVGRQTLNGYAARRAGQLPVRIAAGALGEALPERDLLVSPAHAIGFGDVLVQAGALVNGTTIRQETAAPWSLTYWHVELDRHALLLAEGVPAESFMDNVEPVAFDNAAERPEAPPIAEMELPRAQSHRQVPARVRALIAERVAALAAADAAAA